MHAVILAMIVAVVTFPYLVRELGWLPWFFLYTPEVLSMLVAAYVIVMGVQGRFRFVRPVYWLVFGALLMLVVASAVANGLQPGPMFAGFRTYLRALPFFLLPAVLLITDRQLRVQLSLLMVLCAIQLPIAIQQRLWTHAKATYMGWIEHAGTTGDWTTGTLMGSNLLSVFLISAACVLTGFYLRRQLSAGKYLILLLVILLPTTLNETKATLFLVPVALLITFVVGAETGRKLRNVVVGVLVASVFLAIFIPIYDYFMVPRWGYGLIDFLTMEGRLDSYLARGVEAADQREGGTLDSMFAALAEISRDPLTLLFGFGIGNASDSALGSQFDGEHYRLFQHFAMKSISYLLLEHGLLGLLVVLLLQGLIFLESVRLAHRGEGALAALALGWCGASVVVAAALIYTEIIAASVAISYLYWYLSGVVVAGGMRHDIEQHRTVRARASTSSQEQPPPTGS